MCSRDPRVNDNLGLVHSCAAKFRGRGIEYDDLYQAGCVGLIKAAERYDPGLGNKFSTYAVPVILGEIKRLFRDGGAVKVSRSIKELALKIGRERESYIRKNGTEPTISKLAELTDSTKESVIEAINASTIPLSLTATTQEGEIQTDIPVPSHDTGIIELMSLRSELERLDRQDRLLLELRYFRRLTQSRTASVLGMTQVQVSRREKKLLMALKRRLEGA